MAASVHRSPLLLLAVLALAGCTSTGDDAGAVPPGTTVRAVTDVHHGERFEPANVTIGVGEAVTFEVVGGFHTVDFQDAAGVSSPHQDNLGPGAKVRVTFEQAGTFRYYCQYHLPGMTGTVTVA